jgi:hypothetical protein
LRGTEAPKLETSVSEKNPIRVYVTHCFAETDDYLRVFEFLESVHNFFYLNCARPDNVPQQGGPEAIKDELIAQIKECEVVVVLASLYMEKPDLLRFQMDVAEANDKPMVVIRPFGGVAETAKDLAARVTGNIEWNEREIVDSLKKLARDEDTQRWEVIDFP